MGITYNKPVLFLVMLIIIMTPLFFVVNKISFLTLEGRKYIDGEKKKYSWLLRSRRNSSFPDDISPVTVAALYGVSSLYIFSDFGIMPRIMPISYAGGTNHISDDGGCSTSGCSSSGFGGSDGGSDGGSGCGGGGGCGGCGGGGD